MAVWSEVRDRITEEGLAELQGAVPMLVSSGRKGTLVFLDAEEREPLAVARFAKDRETERELLRSARVYERISSARPQHFPRFLGKLKVAGLWVFVEEGVSGRRMQPGRGSFREHLSKFMDFMDATSGLLPRAPKEKDFRRYLGRFKADYWDDLSEGERELLSEAAESVLSETWVFTGGDATHPNLLETPGGLKKVDWDLAGGVPLVVMLVHFLGSYRSSLETGRDASFRYDILKFLDDNPSVSELLRERLGWSREELWHQLAACYALLYGAYEEQEMDGRPFLDHLRRALTRLQP